MSQAAKILGVHRDSLSYWEENKMIPAPRRNPKNNYRIYNDQEILEIAKIRGVKVLNLK
jgi:DNA-binding transcriptional MerR regulator